jgi:hypothetical protein
MSKTVLEQALEHLLNKEEDAASALIHNYYVDMGRKVYEDIMADDLNLEEEPLDGIANAVDEVDADLTEVDDDEEMPADDEMSPTDDVADGMDADPEMDAGSDATAADVADAMVDVESALAKLKAEFEEMLTGTDTDGDDEAGEMASDDGEMAMGDEMPAESIEESVELSKVGSPDNGDKADEKHSPVAGKNPVGARPAVKFGAGSTEGVASGTSPAKAPSAQDQGGNSRPNVTKVAKPGTAPGREAGSSPNVLPRG